MRKTSVGLLLAVLLLCLATLRCHGPAFIEVFRGPPSNECKLGAPMRGTLTALEGVSDWSLSLPGA
jgi:hypothetical protein